MIAIVAIFSGYVMERCDADRNSPYADPFDARNRRISVIVKCAVQPDHAKKTEAPAPPSSQ
jgi:hypothetical protein